MEERDPNLVTSGLSETVTRAGISVELSIYRLETDQEWILEVVNAEGTSIIWDDPFKTDADAKSEFERFVTEEGMHSFLDSANVIPFPKGR